MNTDSTLLPSVRRLAFLDAALLTPECFLFGLAGLPVSIPGAALTYFDFFGDPQLSFEETSEGGRRLQSVKLVFSTGEVLPSCNLAFVVTDQKGGTFLIGSHDHPRATVTSSRSLAAPSSGNAALSYTVSHKAIRTLIPCKIG